MDAATPLAPSELRNLVYQRLLEAKKILGEIPDRVHVGAFVVSNTALRHHLAGKCQRLAGCVQDIVQDIAAQKASQVAALFGAV